MHRLNTDVSVMQSIIVAMEGSNSATGMGKLKRTEAIEEVEILQDSIRASCKRLLNKMTDEEIAKLDIVKITSMFGDENKKEIIDLLKR